MRSIAMLVLLAGCAAPAPLAPGSIVPEDATLLSSWGLFEGPLAPAPGVVPYDVIAPAISDHARKQRWVRVPDGARIEVVDGEMIFPVGTVIAKAFGFERTIETRLFVLGEAGWTPYVYLWREDGSDAELTTEAHEIEVTHVDPITHEESAITWRVPATIECAGCHARDDGALAPNGLRLEQLDDAHRAELGMGDVAPAATLADYRDEAQPLDARARSYLHANCASCHRPGGMAGWTGVELGIDVEDPAALGVCRPPVLASEEMTGGRAHVIAPGDPDGSVLAWRIESRAPGVHMPFDSVVVDAAGVELLRAWIASMPGTPCE